MKSKRKKGEGWMLLLLWDYRGAKMLEKIPKEPGYYWAICLQCERVPKNRWEVVYVYKCAYAKGGLQVNITGGQILLGLSCFRWGDKVERKINKRRIKMIEGIQHILPSRTFETRSIYTTETKTIKNRGTRK